MRRVVLCGGIIRNAPRGIGSAAPPSTMSADVRRRAMTSSSPSFLNQFLKADSQLLVVKFPLLEAPDEANFVEHRGTALLVKARDLLHPHPSARQVPIACRRSRGV